MLQGYAQGNQGSSQGERKGTPAPAVSVAVAWTLVAAICDMADVVWYSSTFNCEEGHEGLTTQYW